MFKYKKTGFESFAMKFLICSIVVYIFGNIGIKAVESTTSNHKQRLEKEIVKLDSTIDGLQLNKQDLVSFSRLYTIAQKKGYNYRMEAMATAKERVTRTRNEQ